MSLLQQAFEVWADSTGLSVKNTDTHRGYPCDPPREAFFAGAAFMAELFAAGSGPLLEELRGIREELRKQTEAVMLGTGQS